jgi:hypothetical protein
VSEEKKIAAGDVRHQQRWESGIAPDHALRRRQGAKALAKLAQREEDNKPEEGAQAGPEDGETPKEDPEQIDQPSLVTLLRNMHFYA